MNTKLSIFLFLLALSFPSLALAVCPYDPNCLDNPYGRYGSPYSPDSINNPFGAGNPYSNEPISVVPSR